MPGELATNVPAPRSGLLHVDMYNYGERSCFVTAGMIADLGSHTMGSIQRTVSDSELLQARTAGRGASAQRMGLGLAQ
jgi:hypothetical protein